MKNTKTQQVGNLAFVGLLWAAFVFDVHWAQILTYWLCVFAFVSMLPYGVRVATYGSDIVDIGDEVKRRNANRVKQRLGRGRLTFNAGIDLTNRYLRFDAAYDIAVVALFLFNDETTLAILYGMGMFLVQMKLRGAREFYCAGSL